MKPLIVESAQLMNVSPKRHETLIGKPILASLREQRRENVLCDILIQCEIGEVLAHRCVMFAVSEYCKTLCTGSLPPTYREGMVIMDLTAFSRDTVKLLIDLIYMEENYAVNMIDVRELMQLADYLQVPVTVVTEMLRSIINMENCIQLFEMSLSYNCLPLQKVIESFICSNLKALTERPSWNLCENTLSSLKMSPFYLSQPVEVIGAEVKAMLQNLFVRYNMITYDRESYYPSIKSRTYSVENDREMTVHNELVNCDHGKQILYFVFKFELYAIISGVDESHNPHSPTHTIYKYNQQERSFSSIMQLSSQIHYVRVPNNVPLPSFLPSSAVAERVITSLSDENIYILFMGKCPGLWLTKLNMGQISEPSMELEKKFNGMDGYFDCTVVCKRSLYFFGIWDYFVYDFDSKSLKRCKLTNFVDEDVSPDYHFCEFKGVIFVFILFDDPRKLKVYRLNEDNVVWELLSEHFISPSWFQSHSVSSPNEMFLVLDVRNSENEDEDDDCRKMVYRYDPASKELPLWIEFEFCCTDHLFVPEHVFM